MIIVDKINSILSTDGKKALLSISMRTGCHRLCTETTGSRRVHTAPALLTLGVSSRARCIALRYLIIIMLLALNSVIFNYYNLWLQGKSQ
jgi:hypothetical protein